MRSWGRSARGGGAAARNAPPGLAPRPPAALRCCALSLRASLPVPGVAPPSPSARSLSLLRVVTKHYKKAGRAVPGIGGRGPVAAYIPVSAASAASRTQTPCAATAATPACTPPADPARAAALRFAPGRSTRGRAGGRAGAPAKPEGRARENPFVDFKAANIWAQRGPPLAAQPPPRLGDRRRHSPKAGVFALGPGKKEGRGVEGGGPRRSRELFPVSPPLPGSFPAGRGRGTRPSGWKPEIPGSRNTQAGALGLLISPPYPHASDFFLCPRRLGPLA